MKSNWKKRMLAVVLCMVIALSNSSFIFASTGTEEPAAVAQEGDPQNVQEVQTEAAVQDTPAVLSETTPEATPEATPEPTQVPEVTAEPTEAPQATAEPTQAPEATPVPTATLAVTAEPTQAPEVTAAPETTPEATPVPTEAPVTYNEAVELRHEFKDENGNVTATVTAQIPAGAFQADASELTMEVTVPDQDTTEHVKKLMEESLPEHYMLGDTVLYDIRFKVNGTETESQQPIVITFENQNGITVKDVKKAVVFQLDPADPAVEGDKDELVTITQRNDMIESLQNFGQSTDNVDDYDLSEITLKEDGTSNKIQMEGRTSTIYGCYAYYEPVQVLTYEDDQVTVTVSAAENGVIPANAELKVVPITEDKETEDQYKDVEKKLQEKAEEEEYEIAGFLAYDITFVDPDGNETEPNGEVKVSIDYNEAAIPERISEEEAQNAEVTVLHLEEDEKGEVKEVVDMAQTEKVDVLATTEENKVEKAEVRTESFSVYTITWKDINSIYIHYVDTEGKDIDISDIFTVGDINKDDGSWCNISGDGDDSLNFDITISGYLYKNAYLLDDGEKKNVKQIKKDDKDLKYRVSGKGSDWEKSYAMVGDKEKKGYHLYLVYDKNKNTPPQPVPTNSENIEINLFNYKRNINTSKLAENGFGFWASTGGVDGASSFDGKYTNGKQGTQGLYQGIVKNNLGNEGLPVLNTQTGIEMEELFSNSNENIQAYTNLSGLFQYDKSTGYYCYDSEKNGAVLIGNEIKVYDTAVAADNSNLFYGNFFPFNAAWLESAEQGVTYPMPSRAEIDYWYGMNVAMNFYQPAKGTVNSEDMIFEFSGDDDVWVFIDGVLVLDLGGIHARLDGTINFATGEINISSNNIKTTLKDRYKLAYKEKNPSASEDEINSYLSSIFDEQGRFLSYSDHRLEFFYLERGGGAANCRLKFNMPSLPSDGITVAKEISNYEDGAYTDVTFDFELYLDKNGNNVVEADEKVTSEDGEYRNYTVKEMDSTGEGEARTLGEDGIFTLKHGEMATFLNIPVNTKYKVKEVGVSFSEYDQIIVNSGVTDVTGTTDLQGENTNGYAETKELKVGVNTGVVFRNRCNATNMKQLKITKQSNGDATDEFQIQVKIGGKAYNGEYKISGETETKYTENGIIKITPGQEITILGNARTEDGQTVGFPSGTSFEVKEIELDTTKYKSPTYEVKQGTADDIDNSGLASGKFSIQKNAEVLITNYLDESKIPEEVPHNKMIDYLGDVSPNNPDTSLRGKEYYRLYLDVTGIPSVEPEPADIVLVLDYSSSMESSYGNETRMEGVKRSAKVAVNTLLPEDSTNRIAIVWFDRNADNDFNMEFTNDKNQLIQNIDSRNPDSGTNYQAAFQKTEEFLDMARPGSKKFVIFVTDGEPYQWVDEDGTIKYTGTEDAKKHASEEARNIQGISGFFAVSVGREAGKTYLQSQIVDNVGADIKDTLEANDEEELINAFGKVLSSITKQIGNVTIEDELSEVVQFVDETGSVLSANSMAGDQNSSFSGLKVTVRNKEDHVSKSITYDGNYTWTINQNKITVNFGNDFFLERDKVYTISFNVKLTDKAYEEYRKNGYLVNGDPGTDYDTNSTSSDRPGLYSNTEARVSYKRVVNGVEETEYELYSKPVVQVPSMAEWKIVKKGSTDNILLGGAKFTLVSKTSSTTYQGESSNIEGEKGYVKWTENGETVKETDILPGEYTLTEIQAPEGYCISENTWNVIISNTELPVITPNKEGENSLQFNDTNEDGIYEVSIYNKAIYNLPSTGGSGIFWYLISGTAFLMAASLILYRMKRKEVLGK